MLASVSTRRPTTVEELISPRLLSALETVDFAKRRLFGGKLQGERRSKARGRSVEFEDYRAYVPGDDLRHIDWNVFARLDRFFIKIFQEEQDLAVHVVVDASASMEAGTPSKLVQAQRVAMALGYLGLVNNNRVAAWIFGGRGGTRGPTGGLRRIGPERGRIAVQRLAKFLLDETFPLQGGGTGPSAGEIGFTDALTSIASARSSGGAGAGGIIVVLSDAMVPGGYAQGLSALAAGGRWDVVLVQVLSPGELDPLSERDGAGEPIVVGDLRLTDSESGRGVEVTVTHDLVRAYRARLAAYQEGLTSFCRSRGIQLTTIRSDSDPADLLLTELRRRGLVG